jgi:hypothetical protein
MAKGPKGLSRTRKKVSDGSILFIPQACSVHPSLSGKCPVRGTDDVRIFFENMTDEIEIPIYDFPAHLGAEDSKS